MSLLLLWLIGAIGVGIAIGLWIARKDAQRADALKADRQRDRMATEALRAQLRRDVSERAARRLAERSHPTTVVSKCGCAWLVSVNSQTRNQSRCPVHGGSVTASASLTPKGAA